MLFILLLVFQSWVVYSRPRVCIFSRCVDNVECCVFQVWSGILSRCVDNVECCVFQARSWYLAKVCRQRCVLCMAGLEFLSCHGVSITLGVVYGRSEVFILPRCVDNVECCVWQVWSWYLATVCCNAPRAASCSSLDLLPRIADPTFTTARCCRHSRIR